MSTAVVFSNRILDRVLGPVSGSGVDSKEDANIIHSSYHSPPNHLCGTGGDRCRTRQSGQHSIRRLPDSPTRHLIAEDGQNYIGPRVVEIDPYPYTPPKHRTGHEPTLRICPSHPDPCPSLQRPMSGAPEHRPVRYSASSSNSEYTPPRNPMEFTRYSPRKLSLDWHHGNRVPFFAPPSPLRPHRQLTYQSEYIKPSSFSPDYMAPRQLIY